MFKSILCGLSGKCVKYPPFSYNNRRTQDFKRVPHIALFTSKNVIKYKRLELDFSLTISVMELLSGPVFEAQQETIEAVEKLIEEKGVKAKALAQAQKYAQSAANYIQDPTSKPPESFPGIQFNQENLNDYFEYYLVMDYLESIGLKFAPTVFRYESQTPSEFVDRTYLEQEMSIRGYDKTPCLVQIIEQIRKAKGSK